ncbi:MAG: lipase family protein [Tannerella sp.]|jgi:pimeloyl-ACP methyl ester carboxylesterase|nr:lipase family protein [Tannerella sp.]
MNMLSKSGFLWVAALFFTACSEENGNDYPVNNAHTYFESKIATKDYNGHDFIAGIIGQGYADALNTKVDLRIDAIRYHTVDPASGDSIIASGIISYPQDGRIKGLVLAEHPTICSNEEAPSVAMQATSSFCSIFRYAVVSPDYIGYGASADRIHPYMHLESTARASIDMLFAAREYMKGIGLPLPDSIFIVGYSQGGQAALAVQKVAEESYADAIPIKKVMAGGGPYDLSVIFDALNQSPKAAFSPTTAMAIIGLNDGDRLNLDYRTLFREPLLSHYKEWLLSKQYTLSQIEDSVGKATNADMLAPLFFEASGDAVPEALRYSMEQNSLIAWTPKAPLLLVHGTKDELVPILCAQRAYDSFTARGADVSFEKVAADHRGAAIPFFLDVIASLVE